jgi:predicted Ser/Thr protein kinase
MLARRNNKENLSNFIIQFKCNMIINNQIVFIRMRFLYYKKFHCKSRKEAFNDRICRVALHILFNLKKGIFMI